MFKCIDFIILGLFFEEMSPITVVDFTKVIRNIFTNPNNITVLGILKKRLVSDLANSLIGRFAIILFCLMMLDFFIWTFGVSGV